MSDKTSEGLRYYRNINNSINHGFAFGASGIGLFFIKLYQMTNQKTHKLTAESFLEYDISKAQYKEGIPRWSFSDKNGSLTPYWDRGSSGIGSSLIRFYEITGKSVIKIYQ